MWQSVGIISGPEISKNAEQFFYICRSSGESVNWTRSKPHKLPVEQKTSSRQSDSEEESREPGEAALGESDGEERRWVTHKSESRVAEQWLRGDYVMKQLERSKCASYCRCRWTSTGGPHQDKSVFRAEKIHISLDSHEVISLISLLSNS